MQVPSERPLSRSLSAGTRRVSQDRRPQTPHRLGLPDFLAAVGPGGTDPSLGQEFSAEGYQLTSRAPQFFTCRGGV
jgi:hypothetical protein